MHNRARQPRASCRRPRPAQSTAPPGANQCSTLSRRPPTARGRCSARRWPTHHHQETLTKREEYTLGFTTIAFMAFSVIEMIYAAEQLMALLGDAAAMMVDACTYMFNGCAIRRARQQGKEQVGRARTGHFGVRAGRAMIPPYDAVSTLASGASGDGVNLVVVLAFGLRSRLIGGVLFWPSGRLQRRIVRRARVARS